MVFAEVNSSAKRRRRSVNPADSGAHFVYIDKIKIVSYRILLP